MQGGPCPGPHRGRDATWLRAHWSLCPGRMAPGSLVCLVPWAAEGWTGDLSHPWQVGPPRGAWMGSDRDVHHRGRSRECRILPIDVAGSLSEARPGQACSQWLTPRPPRDTGGGVGTGQGWSWGSEPPQDVKGNTPTPGREANTNETEKFASECCLNCNLPRQFGVIHRNK